VAFHRHHRTNVTFSLTLPLSLCLSFYFSFCLSFYPSISFSFSLSLSIFLPLCLLANFCSLSFPLAPFRPSSLPLFARSSLPRFHTDMKDKSAMVGALQQVSLFLSLSLSLSLAHTHTHTHSLYLFLSFCLSLPPPTSFFSFLSRSLSHTLSLIHMCTYECIHPCM